MSPTTSAVLGSVLGFGGTAAAWASRFMPGHRPAEGPEFATFTPPPTVADDEEVVWRVCDTTACAHLTRRHTLREGTTTCHECGTTRMDHQ